eukprot:CAMPEP_0202458930 /NCGR_PEP_ID=MMETSP1360-20130828/28681_1 /ASSEMBLY_ACC=CAM_ASM_000848 /TAXON_ID=515479 /ORGANISM="Licmophora paradoxa, Strain CCMP2313" /LENGTH=481 /DNA_ID=CAMNT_0049079691 /DNA_START=222 /DNA_END=1667 /DNA_ORIENTATION=+
MSSSEVAVNTMDVVCSSTASLQVGCDSPALVSSSSTSTSNTLSDQFEDAPEEEDDLAARPEAATSSAASSASSSVPVVVKTTTASPANKPTPVVASSFNPLDALAIACATAHSNNVLARQQQAKLRHQQQRAQPNKIKQSSKNDSRSNKAKSSKSSKSVSASPSRHDLILASNSISSNDVLCGRGGLTNHHPGNVFFRRLVRLQQESYLRASKREKAGVAKDIVEQVRQTGGKFLKKDPKNPGMWIDIGDKKAREKTSQALREGAPELREELVASGSNTGAPGALLPNDHNHLTKQQQEEQKQLQIQQAHHYHRQSQQPQLQVLLPTPNPVGPNAVTTVPDGNRVRVVSADSSIAGLRPLFHAIQQPHVVLTEEQQMQQEQHHHHQVAAAAAAALSQSPHYQAFAQAYVQSTATSVASSSSSSSSQHHQFNHEPSMLPRLGSKRSLTAEDLSSSSDEEAKRGPRLKLLKSRLQRQESTPSS